jgi:hypothetical protein
MCNVRVSANYAMCVNFFVLHRLFDPSVTIVEGFLFLVSKGHSLFSLKAWEGKRIVPFCGQFGAHPLV